MTELVIYKHVKTYNIKENLLELFKSAIINNKGNILLVKLTGPNPTGHKNISFSINTTINNIKTALELLITIHQNKITSIECSVDNNERNIPQYHLKYYILGLLDDVLSQNLNQKITKYTIRTYSHYFNSHPITTEHLINAKHKFLIKPYVWTSKQESLTEQIMMYDIEVDAIDIDHARTIAYNFTRDINAYLSVLIDVGFDVINSEFRSLVIKKDNTFSLERHRTGFIDTELELIVKDNHYGLKDINNTPHVNSFYSGQWATSFSYVDDNGQTHHTKNLLIQDTYSNSEHLEQIFTSHSITRKPSEQKTIQIPISSKPHYPSKEINIPNSIRKYFKAISNMSEDDLAIFTSFCRMYNTSLNLARESPTIESSYKICAIESLAILEKKSFSQFLKEYLPLDYKKEVCDYFYSLRSSHFHSGKFHFGEFSINFHREIDFLFKEINEDYLAFNDYIRFAIVKWIEMKLL
ncbi:hypothetical protein [Pantoea eucalypti]|uniref:hypothetical protein n=1 Tax=Pantoea eucalypti TaxID=470933 RepID=UPI00301DE059